LVASITSCGERTFIRTIEGYMDSSCVGSKSLERHDTDQHNGNQQQREHLLHYCFHFSNLLMKNVL